MCSRPVSSWPSGINLGLLIFMFSWNVVNITLLRTNNNRALLNVHVVVQQQQQKQSNLVEEELHINIRIDIKSSFFITFFKVSG